MGTADTLNHLRIKYAAELVAVAPMTRNESIVET